MTEEYLEEIRGIYIGPISREEALDAIRGHDNAVIIDYPEQGMAGGEVRRAIGEAYEVGGRTDDDHTEVFAFVNEGDRLLSLGFGIAYPQAFVLDLAAEGWTADQYLGGLDLHFATGVVFRLVFWNSLVNEPEYYGFVARNDEDDR